jgi:sulfate adenylyltransferase large subunit
MEELKFVIVGHVDHGKSTLIGRLLYDTDSLPDGKMDEVRKTSEQLGRDVEFAYVMDNLKEEREQGITIDTAQIFFKTGKRDYVIIDAPGHVEFVKNMITGASQAEAAVLIVDAAEGVQEQTRRHAYILGLLGLKQVIVVLNKIDLVGYDEKVFDKVKDELTKFLTSINATPTYVIPISAKEGENITKKSERTPWYTGPTFLEALDSLKSAVRPTEKPLRFPVQDVYVIDNKRIFAGRVESGTIREGDEVTVLPNPRNTIVKSVEIYLKDAKEAEAGRSIGVTTKDKLFIERGNVLCAGQLPKVADSINAKVFWMSRSSMREGEKLTFRLATQETECRVIVGRKMNSSTLETLTGGGLENNESAVVTIKTDSPVVYENFNDIPELGRFVLAQGNDIVAGGIIT